MEDVGIFYGHLVHFTVFCYILLTFGKVHGNLVYFIPFWYFEPRKIWQPCFSGPSKNDLSQYTKTLTSVHVSVAKQLDSVQFCKMNCLDKSLSMNVF
jgi:hypothetical protein